MQKWQVHSAIGKGRPKSTARCPFQYLRCLHTTPSKHEEGKDKVIEEVSNPLPNRAKRLRDASNEIQNLYARSAAQDRSNAPSPSRIQDRGTATESRGGFQVRYQSEDGKEARPNFQQRATAPADLKERLRQRALQRERGQGDVQGSGPAQRQRSGDRPAFARRPRDDRQSSRSSGLDPSPVARKGGSRSGGGSATSFGASFFDLNEARQHSELYRRHFEEYEKEVVEKIMFEKGYALDYATETDEERVFMSRVRSPNVEPVMPSREAMIATGPGIASGVEGMTEIMADKMRLAAKVLEGEFMQWASREQKEDVLAIVERLKHANPDDLVKGKRDGPATEVGKAEEQTQAIMRKEFGGQYALKRPNGQNDVLGHVQRVVERNKSYFPADEQGLMKEVARLVGGYMQPQGKVGAAVRAGAQEARSQRQKAAT